MHYSGTLLQLSKYPNIHAAQFTKFHKTKRRLNSNEKIKKNYFENP